MSLLKQKAVVFVGVLVLAALVFATLSVFLKTDVAFALSVPLVAMYGVAAYFIERRGRKRGIVADERSRRIERQAARIGLGAFWIAFVVVVTIILAVKGWLSRISFFLFAYLLVAGTVLIYTVRSFVVLVGWNDTHGH